MTMHLTPTEMQALIEYFEVLLEIERENIDEYDASQDDEVYNNDNNEREES